MKIEIKRGAGVDALIADGAFRAEWTALGQICPWSTAFQTPEFVVPWYQTYRTRCEPIVIISRDGDGRLQGFLPLAESAEQGLEVAGSWHAEYQAWICLPELSDSFPRLAMERIRHDFPTAKLRFRYLPPNTPLGWLDAHEGGNLHVLKPHMRPLLRFGDGKEIAKSLAKSGNKKRLKQLEKIGGMKFERINDSAELDALFDTFIGFHDSRHLAIRGSAPFSNDPLKRAFHLALMKSSALLHTTVMQVGGRLAAAHLGARGNKEVQLGLITHSPWLAKQSPGKFHIYLLAQMLLKEGYEQLDLTAGGDPYKERFANAWDEVHTLTILPTPNAKRVAALAAHAETASRKVLKAMGIAPARAQSFVRHARPSTVIRHGARLLRQGRSWLVCNQEMKIYTRDVTDAFAFAPNKNVGRNAMDDLMAYRPSSGEPSRQEFMSAALARIEEGQRVYTYVEDGRLLHVGWIADKPDAEMVGRSLADFSIPANSAVVLDLYTVPGARGRGLATLGLQAMLHDMANSETVERVFVPVRCDRCAAKRVVEKTGFRHVQSFFEQVKFGQCRRWNTVHPAASVGVALVTG